TTAGRGTTFTIKIPLTLAIVAALIVRAGEHRFALPQVAVLELVRVDAGAQRVERINGAPVLRLRERLLPIVSLTGLLGQAAAGAETEQAGFVVVAQVGRERFGILVDEVFHTEEIVVKPMSVKLRHIPMFAGNTILGDGAVVLIVDPNGVARQVAQGVQGSNSHGDADAEAALEVADTKTTLLVFKGGQGSFKAVPLSLVTRLEEIECAKVEWLGGRALIQYRGRLMPLVPADAAITIKSEGTQALVVFSDGERAMGLVVDEIVDIVEERLDIEIAADRSDLIGSAVLRGRATDIINIAHFLPLAYDDWARGLKRPEQISTVLLVDDSAFFRDMLSPVLKAAGYQVVTAASADAALAALEADPKIEVVVTDLEMPGRSGFDLVAAMRRAEPRLAALPVIGLTGAIGADAVERARTLAINDLVAKFDRSGLIAALAEIGAGTVAKAA
ncbi:MAG: chemotaxis protein CheW, partial [Parafilimonas terrae]|nr:chemotaxis protein CheW [Parafilimonas terrae]